MSDITTELDYAPDFSPHATGILTDVTDFVPTVSGSYASGPGPYVEGYTAPTSGEVIGSALVKNKNGLSILYAGTSSKIFQADGGTSWVDRSAKVYSGSGFWEFLQFGDTTVAANGADTLQQAAGGVFSDIAGAPAGKVIVGHENAVITMCLSTDKAGWARSDTGNLSFTATAANDADAGTFLEGSGPVTAGTTFQNLAIAWKGDWMYGGRFVGDIDQKVRWDTIARGVGCVGQLAHITTEVGVFFVSNRDVLLYDGQVVRSIADKIRRTFFARLYASGKSSIFLTHDEVDRNIFIWYPSTTTYVTRALVYNYRSGKWGSLDSIANNATTFTEIRCPVRGANYPDYIALGGTTTNASLSANVVWGWTGSASKLVNYARIQGGGSNPATRSGAPTMTMGYFGKANTDTRIVGIYYVPERAGYSLALSTGSVTSYDKQLNVSSANNVTGSINSIGNLDVNADGRFHTAALAWTSAVALNTELRSIQPLYSTDGGAK